MTTGVDRLEIDVRIKISHRMFITVSGCTGFSTIFEAGVLNVEIGCFATRVGVNRVESVRFCEFGIVNVG